MPIHAEPDRPAAIPGARTGRARRPHAEASVAEVRQFVEETDLSYGEIAAQTGVARATICRWTRDGGWKRSPFAPCSSDTAPSARASAGMRRRKLAQRLLVVAERAVRELEASENVDLERLAEALELMKLAKLAARRSRRGSAKNAAAAVARTLSAPARDVLAGLRAAGIDPFLAPEAAEDFIVSRLPPPDRTGRRNRLSEEEFQEWRRRRKEEE